MADDPQRPTPSGLLAELTREGRARVGEFRLGVGTDSFGPVIWITNPYGLDVGFRELTVEGCEGLLAMIASDTHEREWGSL